MADVLPLTGLLKPLVDNNLLAEVVAKDLYEKIKGKPHISVVKLLVEQKKVAADEIAMQAAYHYALPLVDIEAVALDRDLIAKMDGIDKDKKDSKVSGEQFIRKYTALPLFQRGNMLYVAVADPANDDELRKNIGLRTQTKVELVLANYERLLKVIDKALEEADTKMSDFSSDEFSDLDDLELNEETGSETSADEESGEDAPVVRFVNKMLTDAIRMGASDLHFEPYEKYYRVRFRVDGILKTAAKPPLSLRLKIAARIKVMSRLDVSERRVPQDGRIKLKLSKTKSIDFRVSTCPTLFGEKTVMRILDSDSGALDINKLGYEEEQKKLYLEALANPYGMVLVTGPTGSGKTVSLYTGINILNQEGVNISTAEDPVEINLPGVNQVQIDEKTGMTFDKALKAFLRQDPDIILVGEIRDIVTGSIAIKAASTGHLVMATLHTNDAPQTLSRMIDMGLAPFAIATAVNLIMAQRLCRRLCSYCKVAMTVVNDLVKDQEREVLRQSLLEEGFTATQLDNPTFQLYRASHEGCNNCSGGYKGRVGIYQVMPISDEMRRLIIGGANAVQLADQARKEGIPDLRQSGLKKVADGITSMSEVNRVTQE
jgi:type IV pilus assembly protein PilB